jgi:apolipoprotein N-acyltransferase
MAAVRAIENRLPLVRVANTGISAVVGPDGRFQSTIPLGERAVKVADVGLARRPPSFYTRHGDVFAHGAVLAAALMLLYAGWITPAPEPAVAEV